MNSDPSSSDILGASMSGIEANAQMAEELIEAVQSALDNGDDELCLRLVQATADFCWHNQTGHYSLRELEAAASAVGTRLGVDHISESTADPTNPQSILHVFSEAPEFSGGHARMPRRWMNLDGNRSHSVVVTNQKPDSPVASYLVEGARNTGGSVEVINPQWPTLVERARRLREIARDYDLVVLHVHPYDAVAVAALSGRTAGPTTVWENHADHVFWLGTSIADYVANFREGASKLSMERRGVPAGRSGYLPLPLDDIERTRSIEEAKLELGLSTDLVVLFSAAWGYKYQQADAYSFIELVEPVLQAHNNALLLVAGGATGPEWEAFSNRTGGRVVTLGPVGDMSLLREATDIYVDSYPFPSNTSFLEAAVYKTPVVNFAPYGEDASTLHADDFAANGTITRTTTPHEYASLLGQLIDYPELRAELGAQGRLAIEQHNLGEAWQEHLGALYAQLGDRAPVSLEECPSIRPECTVLDALVYEMHRRAGHAPPVDYSLKLFGVDPSTILGNAARADQPTGPAPQLSVVITTQGDASQTKQCVQSVLDFCKDISTQVVVHDNASDDATRVTLESFENAIELHRSNSSVGWSAAWAEGIAAARGDLVLFLSSDVALKPGWFKALSIELRRDRRLSAVTPSVIVNGKAVPSQPPAAGSGVCFLVRRAALENNSVSEARHIKKSTVRLLAPSSERATSSR
jgi:hypothetical protein